MKTDLGILPDADERRRLTGPALRTAFALAEAWAFTPAERMKLFGLSSRSTLRRWEQGAVRCLEPEAFERVSHLLGIFRAINTLLPDPERADAWLRRPNTAPLFGGVSALDRMTAGSVGDLCAVRRYLEAQLG